MQYKSLPQVDGGYIWSPAVASNAVSFTCKVKQKNINMNSFSISYL